MAQVHINGFSFLIPTKEKNKNKEKIEETMVRAYSASFQDQKRDMHKQVLIQNMNSNRSGFTPINDDEPAYLRIMQQSKPVFKDYIVSAVGQLFPELEITPESVTILNNFLQDTLVWCLLECGRHAERDNANSILSCHVQDALKKLLHNTTTTKETNTSETSSPISTPSSTPDSTPTTTPNSSSNNLTEVLDNNNNNPASLSNAQDPKAPPTLEHIISKRLFMETAQAAPDPPSLHTSYFLLIDHALARFNGILQDAQRWDPPTSHDDVIMFTKPVNGSFISLKAVGDIDKSPREVMSAILDFQSHKKWNNVLFEVKFVEVLDKRTFILYQRYQSKACLLKSERDFCTTMHWMEKDGCYTLVSQSVEHNLCPTTKDVVRAKMNSSGYFIEPIRDGQASRVTYLVDVDLISVPSAVSSMVQRQLNLLPRLRLYLTGSKHYISPPPSPSLLTSSSNSISSSVSSPVSSVSSSPNSSPSNSFTLLSPFSSKNISSSVPTRRRPSFLDLKSSH